MSATNGSEEAISVACVSAGSSHSVILLSCDVVVSFGRGEDGQLGHGDADERIEPAAIASLAGAEIDTVICGAEYSVAVSQKRREVYSWGWGDFGRLGHGDCNDVFVPQPIAFFSGMPITRIACGDTHSLAIAEGGELYSFGRNQNGQLGLGHNEDITAPTQVQALAGNQVVSVACGAEHSLAATSDGKVFAWGWGRYGNLGDGECVDRWEPAAVQGLEGQMVASVACGWRHSAAVTDDGRVFTFGWSKYGQLGHADHSDRLKAEEVKGLAGKRMVRVAGGWRHTMAADDQGSLYAWGWNKFGQLGLGDTEDRFAPTPVPALSGQQVALLACGWRHTIAVTTQGQVYTWGRGVNGQLGHSDASDLHEPKLLTALCKGHIHALALHASSQPGAAAGGPTSDRYAVVPDGTPGAPSASVPTVPRGPDAKRQRLDPAGVPDAGVPV